MPELKKRCINCWMFSSIEPKLLRSEQEFNEQDSILSSKDPTNILAQLELTKKICWNVFKLQELSAAGWSAISQKQQDLITLFKEKPRSTQTVQRTTVLLMGFIKDSFIVSLPTCKILTAAGEKKLGVTYSIFYSFKKRQYLPGFFIFVLMPSTHPWCIWFSYGCLLFLQEIVPGFPNMLLFILA